MRSFLVLLLVVPLGCVSDPGDGDSSMKPSATQSNEDLRAAEIARRSSARANMEPEMPDRVPARATAAGVTGEVPAELLNKMKTDLAERLSAGDTHISVVVAESVTWNDGSLGCPQPGRYYTQATVPGYRVVLELAGQRYPYHADAGGNFVPCDVQLMTPPPGKTPTQ